MADVFFRDEIANAVQGAISYNGGARKIELVAVLEALGALTTAANKGLYFTGSNTPATFDLTAAARALLDDTDASTMLSTLGVSAFVKTVLDDADGAAVRATIGFNTLGLGTRRCFRPQANVYLGGTYTCVTGRITAVYMGCAEQDHLIKYVESALTTNGAGAQTGEFAICSTPLANNKSAQTMTVLAADGTLDSVTAGATKIVRNTNGFNSGAGVTVTAGTHWWAACRFAMATTQPTFSGAAGDFAQVAMLQSSTDALGALTGLGSVTTIAHIGGITGAGCPFLSAVKD